MDHSNIQGGQRTYDVESIIEEFSEYNTNPELYVSRPENFADSSMVVLFVLCMTLDGLF